MSCNGTCEKYRAQKRVGKGWYRQGFKRCQECEIYIDYDGLRCPCCVCKLRTKPRNRVYKELFRESLV